MNFAKFLGTPFFTEHLRWRRRSGVFIVNIEHMKSVFGMD